MKKMEFSLTLVNTPAKSFGLSSAGALVIRISACNSFAIIEAKVVLPSPGGPTRKVWSNASFLSFAALKANLSVFIKAANESMV